MITAAIDYSHLINTFFIYSFLGWVMETVVIRYENGTLENRGFTKSPFCIIYGFGGILSWLLLNAFNQNILFLFILGALAATIFEYLTGRIMIFLFGKVWWDYSHKKWNCQGLLCLQSTLAWGIIAVLNIKFIFPFLWTAVTVPSPLTSIIVSCILVFGYSIDFSTSFYREFRKNKKYEYRELEI